MTDSFPLPIEVLNLVIINLAIARETKTLVTLLRVNKYVCMATLPILYEDPFIWFMPRDRGYGGMFIDKSVFPLIRLLFAFIPKDSYPGLIKALYGIEDASEPQEDVTSTLSDPSLVKDDIASAPTTQHWPIDYLSYVRHFNTQDYQDGHTVLADFTSYLDLVAPLTSYVEKYKLTETMRAVSGIHLDKMIVGCLMLKEDPIMIEFLTLNIDREATWALCSPILEQLKSIVIPISDVGRYLGVIPRLLSLTTVSFRLDELVDFYDEPMSDEQEELLGQLREKREGLLESAIEFVRTHAIMFPGTLTQVLFPCSTVLTKLQSCPRVFMDRILELLPALDEPTELVNKNWKQFVAKAEHTNLEHVTNIDVWDQYVEDWYDQLKSKPFLHRCTSLRKYNMISLGPDSFKWAAQNDRSDYGKDQGHHEALPPLEDVSIHANKELLGSELDDIGLAFGPTLKSFSIKRFRYHTIPRGSQLLNIGRGWRMPVLSKLFIQLTSSEKLVLDPDFLRYCPSLKSLEVSSWQSVHDLNEIKVSHPAHLPELNNLVLTGAGALAWHPDTLYGTKQLKKLCLGCNQSKQATFVPSLQDISRHDDDQQDSGSLHRPKWTWDWHLPMLSTLHLTVEFASHFQFRMLQGSPNLHDLELCIRSVRHSVERVLTKDDFILPLPLPQNRDQAEKKDTDNRSGQDHTLLKDMDKVDLYRLPFDVLADIYGYLYLVLRERCKDSGLRLEDFHPEKLLMSIYRPSGDYPEKSVQQRVVRAAQTIEWLVDKAGLQPEFEAVLAALQVMKARERQEEAGWQRYRVAHPEHLVVPSLRKLKIRGHWIVSGEVLEMMLGRVFRNVRELDEELTAGCSLDALIRVTQSMPWLQDVRLATPFDAASSLSDEHRFQPYSWKIPRLPVIDDARARVRYQFSDRLAYVLEPSGDSQAQT